MPETRIVSYSELDTFRQCPHKHALGYKERWTSPTTSKPLSRGTLWHAVMEAHYGLIKLATDSGLRADLTARDLYDRVQPLLAPQVGQPTEDQELVAWMYAGYVEAHGLDPDWTIIAIEHPSSFWLPTVRGGRSRFRLKMKIDLIVRVRDPHSVNGRLWIVDHKSCKDLPKQKALEFDDQFGLYTWGLRKMGQQVHGQIHNAARTQRNKGPMELDTRFLRTPMYRSDRELDAIAREAYLTCRRMYGEGSTDERNPDPDRCGWRCDFEDACLHGRKTNARAEREYLRTAGYLQDFTRH